MPPVEELVKVPRFPTLKERYRVSDGGPLGVGRCPYSLYKDYLVNPEVQSVNLDKFVDGSVSSLLEHCLGWRRDSQEVAKETAPACHRCPLLRYLSSCPSPSPDHVSLLCSQYGCDNVDTGGQGPLHVLLSSPGPIPANTLMDTVGRLLQAGARLDQRDAAGNTPLLSLATLLERGEWSSAAQIATMFCTRPDCDVNSVNLQGRSLLSLSVSYLDSSIELTRVLINNGARVWPDMELTCPQTVAEVKRDSEESAFTWFLRSVISQRSLTDTDNTLDCLCHEMGRAPDRMKSHVVRVMLSEGRHPRILGPVFLQLKLQMAPFWTQPQHLTYLAWNSVRRSLGPKRLARSHQQQGLKLPLPPPMIKYLTLAAGSSSGTNPHVRIKKMK